jgi:hypothetical protein
MKLRSQHDWNILFIKVAAVILFMFAMSGAYLGFTRTTGVVETFIGTVIATAAGLLFGSVTLALLFLLLVFFFLLFKKQFLR